MIDVPKNTIIRAVGAALAIVVAGALWLSQRNDSPIKPTPVTSIEGDHLSYLYQQVQWMTAHPVSLSFGVPVPEGSTAEEKKAIADKLFSTYAGPHAEELGFRSVIVQPDDGQHSGEFDILGFKFTFSASAGAGDIDPNWGLAIYDRNVDGTWSRDGAQPGPPTHIAEYALPSGVRFALTDLIEDFPKATLVFDCLSCNSKTAIQDVASNLASLFETAIVPTADRDGIKAVKCVIFFEKRRSAWAFPKRFTFNIPRRPDGKWTTPKLPKEQWIMAVSAYYTKMDAAGRKLRRQGPQ